MMHSMMWLGWVTGVLIVVLLVVADRAADWQIMRWFLLASVLNRKLIERGA